MKNYSFKVGTTILVDDRRLRIARILSDGRVQLEVEADGALEILTRDELLAKYAERKLSFVEDVALPSSGETPTIGRMLSSFSEDVQKKAIRKKRYLDLILNQGSFISTPAILAPLIKMCADILNDENPPNAITVYRWYRELIRNQRDHRALIDRHHLKGGRGSRLHPSQLAAP